MLKARPERSVSRSRLRARRSADTSAAEAVKRVAAEQNDGVGGTRALCSGEVVVSESIETAYRFGL